MGIFSDLQEDLSQAMKQNTTKQPKTLHPDTDEPTGPTTTQDDTSQNEVLLRSVAQTIIQDNMKLATKKNKPIIGQDNTPLNVNQKEFLHSGIGEMKKVFSNQENVTNKDTVEVQNLAASQVNEEPEEVLHQADAEVSYLDTLQNNVEPKDSLHQDSVEIQNSLISQEDEEPEEVLHQEDAEVSYLDTFENQIINLPAKIKNLNEFTEGATNMDTNTTKTELNERSVINAGMIVTGNLNTEGSIDVIGTVKGNIDVSGRLNIFGHINGNSKAAEISTENANITGDVISDGSIQIGLNTTIIGNVTAYSAVISGAIKGDIDVKDSVILNETAIVMGNIKSKSVQINNGAIIEGMCSQCYANINPSTFFSD